MRFSSLWLCINIIFLIFYLYFIPQALILIQEEKQTLQKDSTIYDGLKYGSIYEIVLVLVWFSKIIIIMINKLNNVLETDLKIKIQTIEIFCFIPQIINLFLLVAQISYYQSDKFIHQAEFQKIDDFKIYCEIKIRVGFFYIFWILGSSLIFAINFLLYSCGCNICFFSNKIRNNKVYAV